MSIQPSQDPEATLTTADQRTQKKSLLGWLARLFATPTANTASSDLNQDEAFRNHHKWRQQLLTRGLPARAIVRELSVSGTLVNIHKIATLQLDIHADGHPAWRVAVTAPLSKLDLPGVNEVIEVRYDPINRDEVVLV